MASEIDFRIYILGLAFLFQFSAFIPFQNYLPRIIPGWGSISLSMLYAVFSFSNIIAPFIVKYVGSTRALMFSAPAYILIYSATLLYSTPLKFIPLLVAVFIGGIGNANLWNAIGCYVQEHSNVFNRGTAAGIAFAFFRASFIVGNLVSGLLLQFNVVTLVETPYVALAFAALAVTFFTILHFCQAPEEDETTEMTEAEFRKRSESMQAKQLAVAGQIAKRSSVIQSVRRSFVQGTRMSLIAVGRTSVLSIEARPDKELSFAAVLSTVKDVVHVVLSTEFFPVLLFINSVGVMIAAFVAVTNVFIEENDIGFVHMVAGVFSTIGTVIFGYIFDSQPNITLFSAVLGMILFAGFNVLLSLTKNLVFAYCVAVSYGLACGAMEPCGVAYVTMKYEDRPQVGLAALRMMQTMGLVIVYALSTFVKPEQCAWAYLFHILICGPIVLCIFKLEAPKKDFEEEEDSILIMEGVVSSRLPKETESAI